MVCAFVYHFLCITNDSIAFYTVRQMILNSYGTNEGEIDVRALLSDAGKDGVFIAVLDNNPQTEIVQYISNIILQACGLTGTRIGA